MLEAIRRPPTDVEEILDRATEVQRLREAVREAEERLADWLDGAAGKRWTRERIVTELRRFYGAQPDVSHRTLVAAGRHDLCRALDKHFGSISRARNIAGIPHPAGRRTWTHELLLAEIVARHENGEPLNVGSVNATILDAACRWFGSWRAVIEAVGLDYESVRLRRSAWTRESLVVELRALAERGQYTSSDSLENACRRLFGGVAAARRAAGIVVPVHRVRWSREHVIRKLRETSGEPGGLDENLGAACRRYFGSTSEARKAAGVPPGRHLWTRALIIDGLRAAWQSGAPIDACLGRAARNMFGSLSAARKSAGIPIQQRRTWKKQELLDDLRGRWRSRQIDDKRAEWQCVKYFGSIAAARRAAGFSPLQRKWTERTVLAELRKNWRDRGVDDRAVAKACERYFGSVGAARRAAGLPHYRAGNDRRFAAKQ